MFKLWLMLLTTAMFLAAAPTKGVQAVLLHCWSQQSVRNFTSTVIDTGEREIEVSFSPYIDRCNFSGENSSNRNVREDGRFASINAVLSQLLARGIRVRVVVFLDDFKQAAVRNPLDDNARSFWARVVAPYFSDSRVSFAVGGSLEDQYRNDTRVREVFARISAGLPDSATNGVQRLGNRFAFRRSPLSDGSVDGNPALLTYRMWNKYNAYVRHEWHGQNPARNYHYYSNDGVFVGDSNERCSNCQGSAMSVTTFKTKRAQTVNLWRPAYNLFAKSTSANLVTYSPNGNNREDSNQSPKFDATERRILTNFLR
jgi:hypothetical protein